MLKLPDLIAKIIAAADEAATGSKARLSKTAELVRHRALWTRDNVRHANIDQPEELNVKIATTSKKKKQTSAASRDRAPIAGPEPEHDDDAPDGFLEERFGA